MADLLCFACRQRDIVCKRTMHIGCAIRDEDNEQENGVVVYTNGANGGDVPAREDKVQQVEGHAEESESSGEDELPELISEAAAISEYNGMHPTPAYHHA